MKIMTFNRKLAAIWLVCIVWGCNIGPKNYLSDVQAYEEAWSSVEIAKGTVYEDLNRNGKMDSDERGIPKVPVSNGEDVVLTDDQGYYELKVGIDHSIFVIKPSAYQVPVNEKKIPQYFYTHKPKGSPKMEYAGVEPTGKLPEQVNFGLIPTEYNENFTALIFGDPQTSNRFELDHFEKEVIEEVQNVHGVNFGITMGDIMGDDLSLYHLYIDAISKIGVPWYNVLGNHDLNRDAITDRLSDETFEAHFGPSNYAFNQGLVHFIVLDNVLYPDPKDGKNYWGGFRDDQLKFIKNDLQYVPKDHLIVLTFHIPLKEREKDTFQDENRQQLFDLLSEYPYTLSLSAHTHVQNQDFFSKEQGWKQERPHHEFNIGTTCGDRYSGFLNEKGIPKSKMKDGTPKGYAFLDFTGNQYFIRYKVVGQGEDKQMGIFLTTGEDSSPEIVREFYVNFFMGSEEDQLRYRIDDGMWTDMIYQEDYDPEYLQELSDWDLDSLSGKANKPSNAEKSTHLWKGDIQGTLGQGVHVIEVEATDMFGRKHYGKKTFPIR
ncbi:calcineurin-like phosphoesterase family protein [Echinicola sediminis]